MEALPAFDLFGELGLPFGAPELDVERAQRRLAKRWHPDRPGGDTARMARINQAADWLTEPVLRARYLSARRPTPAIPAARRGSSTASCGPNDALVRAFLARIADLDDAAPGRAIGLARHTHHRQLWDLVNQAGLRTEAMTAAFAARDAARQRFAIGGPDLATTLADLATALVVVHVLRSGARRDGDRLFRHLFATGESPFEPEADVRPIGWVDRLRDRIEAVPTVTLVIIGVVALVATAGVADLGARNASNAIVVGLALIVTMPMFVARRRHD